MAVYCKSNTAWTCAYTNIDTAQEYCTLLIENISSFACFFMFKKQHIFFTSMIISSAERSQPIGLLLEDAVDHTEIAVVEFFKPETGTLMTSTLLAICLDWQ